MIQTLLWMDKWSFAAHRPIYRLSNSMILSDRRLPKEIQIPSVISGSITKMKNNMQQKRPLFRMNTLAAGIHLHAAPLSILHSGYYSSTLFVRDISSA